MYANFHRHLALSAALVLCAPLQASATTLADVLASAQASYRGQGMAASHDPAYAYVGRSQSQTFRATVKPNTTYVIHADCGGPCTDVDLFAYDAAGNVIAKDTSLSRSAMVSINTNGATELRYSVRMAGCSDTSCAVGAFLMAKPTSQAGTPARRAGGSGSSEVGWGEVAVGAVAVGAALCWLTDCLSSSNTGSTRQCRMEDEFGPDGRGGMRYVGRRQVCY